MAAAGQQPPSRDQRLGDLLRRGIDRAAGAGPPLDVEALASAAAKRPYEPVVAARPPAFWRSVWRLAAMALLAVGAGALALSIAGERSAARTVAASTERLVDAVLSTHALDGLFDADRDLVLGSDPLAPVFAVDDLF